MNIQTYTSEQLTRYFDHIELSKEHRQRSSEERELDYLKRIQRHQLASVPWENLSLHYSSNLTPVLALTDPQEIFDKVVGSGKGSGENGTPVGGRGGVCFENNILFGTVLRSLSFQLYPVGGRVNHGSYFTTWEHLVNLVTIQDQAYAVDVGFGGRGQTQPLPLVRTPEPDREARVDEVIAPATGRLVLKNLPEHTNRDRKIWMYQWRSNDDAEWDDKYAFTEEEFMPVDFQAMSVNISYRRNSFFMHSLAMTRMVLAQEIGEEGDGIVGEIALTGDRVRRYLGGKEDVSEQFETEADRLKALKKWFGIELSQRQKTGVKGTAIALPFS